MNSTCIMFSLTLTSLRSLVFPNKILSISVVCSTILSQSLIRKYITIRTSHRSRISTRSLEQLILNSSIIFIKIPPWNIFYPVSLKNSGHVTQFAEYLLHILHSISSWIPSMLTVLTLHIISEKVTLSCCKILDKSETMIQSANQSKKVCIQTRKVLKGPLNAL